MSAGPGPVGWAFLVARTPTDGYRLMLGPDEPAWRGLIVRNARPDVGAVGPTIELVPWRQGDGTTTLSMVSLTHRLTTADLTLPESSGTDRSELVLDEHGRPIDVVYGFVCLGAVREPADLDLQAARRQALDAYCRVLTDGEAQPATPYPLTSTLDESPTAHPVTGPGAGQVAAQAPYRGAAFRTPRARAVMASVLTAVLATLIGVTVLVRTSTVIVPDTIVGTWTGTYPSAGATSPVTVTIACGQPCEVRPGDQIGWIRLAACEHRVSVRTVEAESLTLQSSTVDRSGCVVLGVVRISATDRPGVVTVEWDGGPPLPAAIRLTRA
jgi:hypothetical protein